ncbi:MAG: RusA family crossover junction endodeoxyribonuclease [Planctomycetaceae bacterium]|jgi:hypothetical protein|nr:RusA family crossover junction endodeoxyribonuclease [Planctomycetaceae bacterium]
MYNFIVKKKAKSFNSYRSPNKGNIPEKDSYAWHIHRALELFWPDFALLNSDLYGIVYYFYKKNSGIDADNISKPVWDSLTGKLYANDNQVKMRVAGTFDISRPSPTLLDFSNLKENMVVQLLSAIEEEDHIIYIECGHLSYSLYKFGIENNGN